MHVITQNLISDFSLAYSTFRNYHVCYSFWIPFDGNKTTFVATSHVPLALKLGRKRILEYLEPIERVWWLQMSFFYVGGS